MYLLRSVPAKKLYFGYIKDLRARLAEYNNKHSKATKMLAPFELVYYEAYKAKKDALIR